MKKLIAVIAIFFAAGLHGQNKKTPDTNVVVSKHQIRIGDVTINYTATTGFMLMKDENDSLKQKYFLLLIQKMVKKTHQNARYCSPIMEGLALLPYGCTWALSVRKRLY
jgi:hypothetical protein